MLPQDKLDLILRKHEEISAKLSEGASGQEFVALSRELSDLDPVVDAIRAFRTASEDLTGLEAMLADGARFGKVRDVLNFGAGDILEIDTGAGETQLLPFTLAVVPQIDIAGRRIVVAPPVFAQGEEEPEG